MQGAQDRADGREATDRGWRGLLTRIALFARACVVGQQPEGLDDAEDDEGLRAEKDSAVGMKPYSRSDAEALRVLDAVLHGEPHGGCGQHVHYWLDREWAVLLWRHDGEGRGKIDLRISNLGRREVAAWRQRKMHA